MFGSGRSEKQSRVREASRSQTLRELITLVACLVGLLPFLLAALPYMESDTVEALVKGSPIIAWVLIRLYRSVPPP